jgi:hypothetical protein
MKSFPGKTLSLNISLLTFVKYKYMYTFVLRSCRGVLNVLKIKINQRKPQKASKMLKNSRLQGLPKPQLLRNSLILRLI